MFTYFLCKNFTFYANAPFSATPVAEIDRLLTHIRLDREQLENEIFQDATDPNFAAAPTDHDNDAK